MFFLSFDCFQHTKILSIFIPNISSSVIVLKEEKEHYRQSSERLKIFLLLFIDLKKRSTTDNEYLILTSFVSPSYRLSSKSAGTRYGGGTKETLVMAGFGAGLLLPHKII